MTLTENNGITTIVLDKRESDLLEKIVSTFSEMMSDDEEDEIGNADELDLCLAIQTDIQNAAYKKLNPDEN